MNFKTWLETEDYRGTHQAPSNQNSPLHDLTNTYPDDIYGSNGARYYGHGNPSIDNYTISIIQSARNKPNMQVEIYRAMPKVLSKKDKIQINSGDWVTINKDYAVEHGESSLLGKYRILTKTVPAKTLFTNGDSIHEWGYNP